MNTANNLIVATYLLYLMISVALTIWVARTLHKRGGIFLVDAFHGNAELADSVNHLLVVGFYLINIGFVSIALKTDGRVRLFTRRGCDWSERYPLIAKAVAALRATSATIDGEAVCCDESGVSV
jgi:hypothetical protein